MDEKWNTNIQSQPLLGLISEALSDDSFSYSDTLNILTSAASEGFSSAEIDDLKYIYSQNSFESDYVKNITYNVVFENVGNDYWEEVLGHIQEHQRRFTLK